MRKPSPTLPSSAVAGTRTSSSVSGTVLEARRPILSSWRPACRPFAPPSTRNAEIPFAGFAADCSVRAQTMSTPARSPEVIHCLEPLRTNPDPSRRAVVRRAPASDPLCASERAKLAATKRPLVISGT